MITDEEEPSLLSWLTYAQEYTHALQDHRFNLSTLVPEEDNFDSNKAILALVEGDAKLVEHLFYESLVPQQQTLVAESLERMIDELSRSPEAASAPRIIRKTFGWEHAVGPQFVFRHYLEDGFETVNELYQHPPQSTEQVLHPEKYLEGEGPRTVSLPDLASALGDGWRQRDSGVLGELRTGHLHWDLLE